MYNQTLQILRSILEYLNKLKLYILTYNLNLNVLFWKLEATWNTKESEGPLPSDLHKFAC